MTSRTGIRAAALLAGVCASFGVALADEQNRAVTTATITNATGAITQFNYDESGAAPESILVGTNVILTFPGNVCGGIGTLGAAGNAVTYSGTGVTFASGFQTVSVTSFTNNTTKASYTKPTPSKPAAYAATAGTIKSLNYSDQGVINGFVFTPTTGAAVFVDIGDRANTTLQPLLVVGASVTVTGTIEAAPVCAAAGTVQEVDAATLLFGTTTITLHGGR